MQTNPNNLLNRVFEILLKYSKGELSTDYEHHKSILANFILTQRTIKMLIPAFPGKSINTKSVLGASPDFGEIEALRTLENLCNEVNNIYPFGCEIYLFHDGHYFFPTGCIRCYEELDFYIEQLKINKLNSSIKHIKINEIFEGYSYEEMVNEFQKDYCPTMEELRDKVLKDENLRNKYVNEYIFVKNEFADELFKDCSASQCKQKSKELALKIMAVEAGMAKLIEEKYPDYFRLSIHVQNNPKSKKFYINLLPNCTNLGTPWFNITARDINGNLKLMKRQVAESRQYTYVENNGFPYYLSNGEAI